MLGLQPISSQTKSGLTAELSPWRYGHSVSHAGEFNLRVWITSWINMLYTMLRFLASYLLSATSFVLLCSATQVVADQVSLPDKSFPVTIAGLTYSILAHPRFETATENDRLRISTNVDLDLRNVQRGLADALDTTWKADKCGDYLRTSNSVVEPQGEGLRIEADVHYVMWACVLSMRTHAATADGRICVLVTMSYPDGILKVDGQLDCFKVTPVVFGAVQASELTSLLHDEALRRLKEFVDRTNGLLGPSQRLYADGLKIQRAFFYDLDNGRLGAKVSAAAVMTGAQFGDFLTDVSKLTTNSK